MEETPVPPLSNLAVSTADDADAKRARITAEIDALLPISKGQLGKVAECFGAGITSYKAIVDAGAAANPGAASNIVASIRAMRDRDIPTAPSRAAVALSSTRSFAKQHRDKLSPETTEHLERVIEELEAAVADRDEQERETSELQDRGAALEDVLAAQGGIYVFTYPHYRRYPTVKGTSRTLLKVGMTTKDAHERVRQQARQTAVPEDPLLLRVYTHPTRDPKDVEKDFHRLLDSADHSRSDSTTGGREWFETSTEHLDTIADVLGMTTTSADDL